MRIAFFSDVHANVQALDAVLADLAARHVDQIYCLGDMVGYGPCPGEVLERLRDAGVHMIMGNHDAAACGLLDPSDFNPVARSLMDWTREHLEETDHAFLRALPYVIEGEDWTVAHCDLVDPEAFFYLDSEEEARGTWAASGARLVFIGHTHEAMIHRLDAAGGYLEAAPQGFVCQPGCRYIVNVGSVGFPRDGDYRAPYVLFDEGAGLVTWLRVPYDLDALAHEVETRMGPSHPHLAGLLEMRAEMGDLASTIELMLPSSETMARLVAGRRAASRRGARSARRWFWFGVPLLLLALLVLALLVWLPR